MAQLPKITVEKIPMLWAYRVKHCKLSRRRLFDKQRDNSFAGFNERDYGDYLKMKNQDESNNRFGRRVDFYEKINPTLLKKVRYVSGISVTPYSVGWVSIDLQKRKLCNFNGNVLECEGRQNIYNEEQTFKIAKRIKDSIPESDIYIMENYKIWRKSLYESVLEIQLLSMLTALFNTSPYGTSPKEKTFFQKRSVIDFLYELNINGERISASHKLQRILNARVSEKLSEERTELTVDFGCINLTFTSDFFHMLFDKQPVSRDACAIAFFLVMSFIELNCPSLPVLREKINHTLD